MGKEAAPVYFQLDRGVFPADYDLAHHDRVHVRDQITRRLCRQLYFVCNADENSNGLRILLQQKDGVRGCERSRDLLQLLHPFHRNGLLSV